MDTTNMVDAEDMASLVREPLADREMRWTIGELARECDVTLRAMRFYEAKGLLKPSREGQNRLYDADDRRRLKLVLRAKRLGFSLVQIRDLLTLASGRDPIDRRLSVLRTRLADQTEQLEQMRREAEESLVVLAQELAALDRALAEG